MAPPDELGAPRVRGHRLVQKRLLTPGSRCCASGLPKRSEISHVRSAAMATCNPSHWGAYRRVLDTPVSWVASQPRTAWRMVQTNPQPVQATTSVKAAERKQSNSQRGH